MFRPLHSASARLVRLVYFCVANKKVVVLPPDEKSDPCGNKKPRAELRRRAVGVTSADHPQPEIKVKGQLVSLPEASGHHGRKWRFISDTFVSFYYTQKK